MKKSLIYQTIFLNFIYWFYRKRRWGERKKKKHLFIVPLTYIFTHWFLHVPCLGIEPATDIWLMLLLTELLSQGPEQTYNAQSLRVSLISNVMYPQETTKTKPKTFEWVCYIIDIRRVLILLQWSVGEEIQGVLKTLVFW